ncbi:predicted protein [Aspergillus terreus NIH2624]|uniref:Extracellular membrane protein CFEM domain-containing protein n=1 Tax=Aspergillus terreus (strain NIH 2624 / FGSC A1156) TaxID=341663 RepID=Q0CS74_ASPTN|nr:uncharacterized protein ATEG_03460 [Aspergillus terreus NIH2624]EAU36734.1 predicted protein [Aspergillus terreus NIH2624]
MARGAVHGIMATMRTMNLLLLLGWIVSIHVASGEADLTRTDCANPQPNDCSFYKDCLEPQYRCGPSGYPIREGYKYCSKSLAVRDRMSPEGQNWVTDTMLCLQRQMVPYALERRQIGCEELGHDALVTHPKCYVDNGWCVLPISDWESDCGGGLSDVLFRSTDDQGSAFHGKGLFIALCVVDRKGPPRWKLDESLSWSSHSAEYIYVDYRDNTLKPMYIWLAAAIH